MILCNLRQIKLLNYKSRIITLRYATKSCFNINDTELTPQIKHDIEKYWKTNINNSQTNTFNSQSKLPKHYVLSMFPYPSGNLHMGHVRVYTISDVMARFHRLNGKNVLHPMGWDAFGLPAENAALQRNIPADEWTQQNIKHMKQQLGELGCSFDWTREIATCDPNYYKWTQMLFLKMFKEGLAYQKEALVNWDPIDKTVLADEQVDANGCSWRSGAKVEKKLLKQWFIKTTKFAKQLFDGLNDPTLVDWRDIIVLQKHWIGDCNSYSFDMKIHYTKDYNNPRLCNITVWLQQPEYIENAAFVVIKKEHILNKLNVENSMLDVTVLNPFNNNKSLPVIVNDEVTFPPFCDTYIGIPAINDVDRDLAEKYGIKYTNEIINENTITQKKKNILNQAKTLNIGGYLVSSKLKDWLISRQRHWGTPIPIVHCDSCGAVPVKENDLPIVLLSPQDKSNIQTSCPNCGNLNATRESDTMDTFVDSSWYFLRYLDSNNLEQMFDTNLVNQTMPVDLYIGGKEHAVLHLYYARFVNHFLHSIGFVAQPEPFKRLLVQGMVMGRSYRIKGSGKYLKENEVKITNLKKNQAQEISTGKTVIVQWEKMSKSKLNGADPVELIAEYSCDTLRLVMLGDVAPTSHRNWSMATFPGILNWQRRLWLTLNSFQTIRTDTTIDEKFTETPEFIEQDLKMWDARNYYIKGTTFNYKYSHQLSVAISKMQGLTSSIRRAPKEIVKHAKQYELALANLIIMLAPMAPHFASELWAQFLAAPNRLNVNTELINWDLDVQQQKWPQIDRDYELDLTFRINGIDMAVARYKNLELESLTKQKAIEVALQNEVVKNYVGDKNIVKTHFTLYPGYEAIISMFLENQEKTKSAIEQ